MKLAFLCTFGEVEGNSVGFRGESYKSRCISVVLLVPLLMNANTSCTSVHVLERLFGDSSSRRSNSSIFIEPSQPRSDSLDSGTGYTDAVAKKPWCRNKVESDEMIKLEYKA